MNSPYYFKFQLTKSKVFDPFYIHLTDTYDLFLFCKIQAAEKKTKLLFTLNENVRLTNFRLTMNLKPYVLFVFIYFYFFLFLIQPSEFELFAVSEKCRYIF